MDHKPVIKTVVHDLTEFECRLLKHVREVDGQRSRSDIEREFQQCLSKILRDNGHVFSEVLSVITLYQGDKMTLITAKCYE